MKTSMKIAIVAMLSVISTGIFAKGPVGKQEPKAKTETKKTEATTEHKKEHNKKGEGKSMKKGHHKKHQVEKK